MIAVKTAWGRKNRFGGRGGGCCVLETWAKMTADTWVNTEQWTQLATLYVALSALTGAVMTSLPVSSDRTSLATLTRDRKNIGAVQSGMDGLIAHCSLGRI